MENITLDRTCPNSVELSRNAKGEYSYSIKLYFDGTDTDRERALATVGDIEAQLRREYIDR
jgi:hypothetical protein